MQRHEEYRRAELTESAAAPNPFDQFAAWFTNAQAAGIPEPNAMTVATATREGRPSARVVLLRGYDERGFVFYTNYESRKGRELAANPYAALTFFWPALERQVRITGTVERVTPEETEAYFHGRPRGSQIGAWASQQSAVIGGRRELDERMEDLAARFGDGEIPVPPFWGGFRLTPETFEFWQGRPSRLHDRLHYVRQADGGWRTERLSP